MAFNKFMHPRNIYRKPPDFTELALKFPEFLAVSKLDLSGSIKIDFKNPASLKALSTALLKKDFQLDVDMPSERLIPAIPLRLNYILWMEDILKEIDANEDVYGIDIGCGATCIYPLLASQINNWHMVASESDLLSYEAARKNVEGNGLGALVKVHHCNSKSLLLDLPLESDRTYDFTMCNPPFFSSEKDLLHTTHARKEERAPPRAARTGSNQELVVSGGEVAFVTQMIKESLQLKDKIIVFSTMLGRKNSLAPVKNCLSRLGINNITQTRFCQGRTMRWAIAWSFKSVLLSSVPDYFEVKKRNTHSLSFVVPKQESVEYNIECITNKIKEIFNNLKLICNTLSKNENCVTFEVVAERNTWSHQRRLRREEKRRELLRNQSQRSSEFAEPNADTIVLKSELQPKTPEENLPVISLNKKIKLEPFLRMAVCLEQEYNEDDNSSGQEILEVTEDMETDIIIKLGFIEGEGGKDAVHQIMQYVINNWNKEICK